MGAVTSLNKKTYLSLCVSSTNVITIQFNVAKHSHSEKKPPLFKIFYRFFFKFHGIKKAVFSCYNKKKPPKIFKLAKSQNYKMI